VLYAAAVNKGSQYLREETKDEAPERYHLADEGTLPGELHLEATRAGLGVFNEDTVDEVSHRGAEGTLDILADVVGVTTLWVEVAPIRVVGVHGDQKQRGAQQGLLLLSGKHL